VDRAREIRSAAYDHPPHQAAGGKITVLGKPLDALNDQQLRGLEIHWGVLFQEGALFSSHTVAENIQIPLREYTDLPQRLMDEIAAMKLSLVGLPSNAGMKYPSRTLRRNEKAGGPGARAGPGSGASLS